MTTTTLRKKGTFDIAFLTGQTEESGGSGRSSPAGDSSDSSIDIVSNGVQDCPGSKSPSTKKPVVRVSNVRKRKGSESSPAESSKSMRRENELVVPQLTSPFNFLPQLKGPPVSPFPPNFQPQSGGTLKRRGFYTHESSDQCQSPPSQFYPPYHPFLIASHQPSPAEPTVVVPNPTLLPPSLAALTLPAQNVCAKCKIGFRMTSDLVYHMRSHHKREADPQQKKREEKLKCPVCHESFRERHHLTRHMTAHQDREEEADFVKIPKILP